MSNGKGSRYRPVNIQKYNKNYDRIFSKSLDNLTLDYTEESWRVKFKDNVTINISDLKGEKNEDRTRSREDQP